MYSDDEKKRFTSTRLMHAGLLSEARIVFYHLFRLKIFRNAFDIFQW